ncbi:hypothetical protein CPB86DRAFT_849784 [Serendipita vermifera]|nr:hypothetical protein CPB86DRAFT_849784 [Serendipita vermifera]
MSTIFYIYSTESHVSEALGEYILVDNQKEEGVTPVNWEHRHNRSFSQSPLRYILISPQHKKAEELIGTFNETLNARYMNWAFFHYRLSDPRFTNESWRLARKHLTFTRGWKGEKWKFFLHKSLDSSIIKELSEEIEGHGGTVVEFPKDAHIVIVADHKQHEMTERYADRPDKRSESLSWLIDAMERQKCVFTRPHLNRNPGRPRGKPKKPFGTQEKRRLVEYLATMTKQGRSGINAYKYLVSNLRRFPWAKNHPAQGWREVYVKNAPWFETEIKAYLRKNPPVFEDGHGFVVAYRSEDESDDEDEVQEPHSRSPVGVERPPDVHTMDAVLSTVSERSEVASLSPSMNFDYHGLVPTPPSVLNVTKGPHMGQRLGNTIIMASSPPRVREYRISQQARLLHA